MELFKDKKEALERLDQLLQEEEEFHEEEAEDPDCEEDYEEDEPEEEPIIYANYSNDYGRIYNADVTDTDLDAFSDEVFKPKKRSNTLLLTAIAFALAAGIMGVLAWWVVRYL